MAELYYRVLAHHRKWHIGQLAPELQEIIRLYPTHFAGALVPILV